MRIEDTALAGLRIITPTRLEDPRGFFSEVYNRRALSEAGLNVEFVQDNHSLSLAAGTIRGLHFQTEPFAQAKLVRVTKGRVLDVAVDLRASSPTFGQHVAVELSAENWRQLFVPAGFAHGFCTIESGSEVLYKVTAHYSRDHDFGLAWDDPALAIAWPVAPEAALLSDKDRRHPRLSQLPSVFP